MLLIFMFTLFNVYLWYETYLMVSGLKENDPDDNFADSWGA